MVLKLHNISVGQFYYTHLVQGFPRGGFKRHKFLFFLSSFKQDFFIFVHLLTFDLDIPNWSPLHEQVLIREFP